MKTLILTFILLTATPSWAIDEQSCKIHARLAEDIATMLIEGINPDNINFADPRDPLDPNAQNLGDRLVNSIQEILKQELDPKQIRDNFFDTCMGNGEVST
tara:strand:+ start:202 stop:504 length:303 start_codon:yes stop_codon:yes gene_type:complete